MKAAWWATCLLLGCRVHGECDDLGDMCQGDDDGAFLQKGKLVQRFRPEGPRLMPSKAPEPSAHAAFLHWRQGEVTKFSALQLYTAHDDMYLKLLFGHMQKADELGNNDGLLTEEECPGLQ